MEMTRDMISCMQTIRRRLRAETGLDIRISQPDAVSQMLVACAASVSNESRRLGQRLGEMTGMAPPPPPVAVPVQAAAPAPTPISVPVTVMAPAAHLSAEQLEEQLLIQKYIEARYSGPLRG
jgi:hypothetical protein